MDSVLIPCPQCGKELRLRDRNLLGKRGKCPKCGHRFILEEPDEVELELAEESSSAVGTSARWVPDDASTSASPSPPPTEQASAEPASGFPPFGEEEDEPFELRRLRTQKRKKRKKRTAGIVAGGLAALVVVGAIFGLSGFFADTGLDDDGDEPPRVDQAYEQRKEELQQTAELAKAQSPTNGEPIKLLFVPAGARIIVYLRPAELWAEGTLQEEFRYCLGPLAEWTAARIKDVCLYEPKQIEEVLICLIPGQRGEPPAVSAVVRLKQEAKRSEFIQQFQGRRVEEDGHPVFVSEDRAYLIHNLKTFASCPADMAGEMADARSRANPTATGIEEILDETDRQRHMTLIFQPHDLRRDQEVLFAENVRPVVNRALDWLGEDVETVVWSLYAGKPFYSELLLRNHYVTSPARLERVVDEQLDKLPQQVLQAVQKMSPDKVGNRRIIGRFPAMVKAVSMATRTGIGEDHVRVTTLLPERAGPNLALGTVLTWDESTRTDFTKPVEQTPSESQQPQSIAERLKQKVDIDFRSAPLHQAVSFIGEAVDVPIELDGQSLKLAGYTQNMEQNHQLGRVPATEALHAIIKQYDEMTFVVDEQKKQAIVTTKSAADEQGLKPFPLKP